MTGYLYNENLYAHYIEMEPNIHASYNQPYQVVL